MNLRSFFILLLFWVGYSNNVQSQCNTTWITSQEELDELANSGCTTIEGNLIVDLVLGIDNLQGLENITHITGGLQVSGDLFFIDFSFDGLNNLVSIGTSLGLNYLKIDNFEGLNSLEFIGQGIFIQECSIETFDGLENLTSLPNFEMYGFLSDANDWVIQNINGLDNLQTVAGDLVFEETLVSDSIDFFPNLEMIGGRLFLENNNELSAISGFNNLLSIGDGVLIAENSNLESIEGFDNIDVIDYLLKVENNILSDCCVLKCLAAATTGNIEIDEPMMECANLQAIVDNCEDQYNDCISSFTIKAFAYHDLNENGIYDEDDYGLQNQTFILQPDAVYSYTNAEGISTFFIEEGVEYTLVWNNHNFWNLTSDSAEYTVSSNDTGTQFTFGLAPVADFTILDADLTSAPTRCGFEVNYWLTYENVGTNTASGIVRLDSDSLIEFLNSDPLPSYVDGDILYWEYEDLLPSYQNQIQLTFQMPGVDNIGAILASEAWIWAIDEAGDTVAQEKAIYESELTCAYDPNDKLVTPKGVEVENYTLFEDSLFQYTIRFQNTGNDTAFNVFITDTLSENLQWETFRVISQSHDLKTYYEQANGIIEFRFDDIYLPDSNVNEPASHGFVKYEIEIKDELAENTLIENTAHIYFDFNPAIVTNTTQNTMVSELPVGMISIDKTQSIHFYPNPTKDYLFLDLNGVNENDITLQLFDILGNSVYQKSQVRQGEILDLSNQRKGIYFLQIQVGEKWYSEKIMVN